MQAEAPLLRAIFERFGVPISAEEAGRFAGHPAREAILLALADREISARFDGAHGRVPNEDDVAELVDIYETLAARKGAS